MGRYAILSDIHGNMYALESIVGDIRKENIKKILLLGDIIDYGMQSNEVVTYISKELQDAIICNIWGNHERAIMLSEYSDFSSERGVNSAKYTCSTLSNFSREYLATKLNKDAWVELELDGKNVLAIHGSRNNPYWKAISPFDVNGDYKEYDIVLSGHSHYPHLFYKFYVTDNANMRNRKAVLFVNPGSVGQPRNHNPRAQYAILDSNYMSVELRAVSYEVNKAMSQYDGSIDDFYRERLGKGI